MDVTLATLPALRGEIQLMPASLDVVIRRDGKLINVEEGLTPSAALEMAEYILTEAAGLQVEIEETPEDLGSDLPDHQD